MMATIDALPSRFVVTQEECRFDRVLAVGPFTKRVTCQCSLPSSEPPDVLVLHCFDACMRDYDLPAPFFQPLKDALSSWIREEEDRLESAAAEDSRQASISADQNLESRVESFRAFLSGMKFNVEDPGERVMRFDEKFRFVMENASSDHLHMIVAKELKMGNERISLLRARDFEVDRLTKACGSALSDSLEGRALEEATYNLSMLNEKLRKVNTNYGHQLACLADDQRRIYRDLVNTVFETDSVPEHIRTESPPACVIKKAASSPVAPATSRYPNESFTIHIGTQVKTTHNVRITQASSMVDHVIASGSDDDVNPLHADDDLSQRLHTLLKLYGNDLSAVVLLVGRDPLGHSTNRTAFYRLCERTTELHFASFDDQLRTIEAQTKTINGRRKADLPESTSYDTPDPGVSPFDEGLLEVGDVLITKHSNLNNAHVVFHLVVDSTLETDEISSRHAVMLGVRKIIQAAAKYTIRHITFPLLLVERMTENMTVQFCLRRTDLVFKCIKGFMMEFCSNTARASVLFPGSRENINAHYTITFVLPSKLSASVFSQIVDQFTSLYNVRVAKLKPSLSFEA